MVVERETQRRAEAFLRIVAAQVAGVWFAIDDQAEDALDAPHLFECQHFLVDPMRGCRVWRADHEQRFGLTKRLIHLAAKVDSAGQFLAVTENRIQSPRNDPSRSFLSDQARGNAVSFQHLVQPVGPCLVGVAVADERTIDEHGAVSRVRHTKP